MLDRDGDENYQPMLIPIDGGYPEPAFGDALSNDRVGCADVDPKRNIAYLWAASHVAQQSTAYRADLATGVLDPMGTSRWGCYVAAANADHTCAILADGYTIGDDVLYQWNGPGTERELLFGKPLEMREPDEQVPLVAIHGCEFADGDRGLLVITALFNDSYGLAYLDLHRPSRLEPIAIEGAVHTGSGELTGIEKLGENRYQVSYNIDGCSWAYEGSFDEPARVLRLGAILCGTGELANGVMESIRYDEVSDRFVLAFSSATSPTQIYTVEGPDRRHIICHTRERVLGISDGLLSSGEDASFTSSDGLRISARLYLPAR